MNKLDRNESILLGIDLQERLIPAMFESDTTVSSAIRLLQGATLLDIPVVMTEQYPKGLGKTITKIADLFPTSTVCFEKTSFSVAGCVEAMQRLTGKQIVVMGVESHVCVLQSVFDLLTDKSNQVFVVADAVSSRKESDKMLALQRMQLAGAQIVSTEMVLFEWLRAAGTPEFKAISQLVK